MSRPPIVIRFGSRLPRLVGHDCVTIRHTIYCRHRFITAHTLAHETRHVEQWARYGVLGFLLRYLWQQVRHGYRGNRLEREAEEYAALHWQEFEDRYA